MHPQMFPEPMDDGMPLTPGGGAKMMPDVGMGQTPEPSQMLKHAVVNLINYQVKFLSLRLDNQALLTLTSPVCL